MKAVVLHEYGPAENLKLEDVADPKPTTGEVLVRVTAAGVNPVDWKLRSGAMHSMWPLEFPFILGFDFAGVVVACGEGVQGFAEGDRVFGRTPHAYAELLTIKAQELGKVPLRADGQPGFEMTVAAAIPTPATTADQLVGEQAGLAAGQTIVLTGALGTVGRFALYRALELGLKVIAVVRKTQRDEALALGATAAVDAGDDAELARLGLVDAVADGVGGALASKLLPHVKPNGVFVSIVGPPQDAALHPTVQVRAFGSHPDVAAMVHLAEAVGDGKLAIPVGHVLPLAEAAQAHKLGEKGGSGKIVLAV